MAFVHNHHLVHRTPRALSLPACSPSSLKLTPARTSGGKEQVEGQHRKKRHQPSEEQDDNQLEGAERILDDAE